LALDRGMVVSLIAITSRGILRDMETAACRRPERGKGEVAYGRIGRVPVAEAPAGVVRQQRRDGIIAATRPAVRVRITIPHLPSRDCRCKNLGRGAGDVNRRAGRPTTRGSPCQPG